MNKTSSDGLKKILPDLLNDFTEFIPQDSRSKVFNYSGEEGLKKVTLNSLKAKKELLIYEIDTMNSFLNYGFSEDVRKGFIKNNIHVRELMNHPEQEKWTEVEEFVKNYWQCRYVDPKILKTNVETLIYNNVVAFYDYKDGKIFCVEIHNKKLADMQKQVFNFVWEYAQKVKVGVGGSTTL